MPTLNPLLNEPSLLKPAVRVVSLEDQSKFTISWDAVSGADGYRVYAGFSPFDIKSLISGSDLLTITSFIFALPALPPTQIVYFWVGSVMAVAMTLLDEMGSFHLRSIQYDQFHDDPFSDTSKMLMAADDQLYFIEEMRRRAKAVQEDAGELVDIFIKQWVGLPDPTTQPELGLDPNFQAMSRDDKTYGVGFYPGFFPAIRTRMRFGGMPQSQLDFQATGLRPLLPNESWTLWNPILHENDLIVRVGTGLRYVVKVTAFSNYRAVPITQRMTLEVVSPTSTLQKVTDRGVRAMWAGINALDYLRIGFSVLPPTSGDTQNYMLF